MTNEAVSRCSRHLWLVQQTAASLVPFSASRSRLYVEGKHVKRRTLLTTASAAAASYAQAVLPRPALAQGAAARTLRFVPQANLTSPDPIWTTATVTRNHAYLVWDTLYGLNTDQQPSPQMCAGHELSDDQLTWRFTLRDGLAFHDGEPVRASDCVASITRWSKRDAFGQILDARLAGLRALDDRRFELRLIKAFPLLPFALAGNGCFVMPERIARTDPFKQIEEIVGSGPFRFVRNEWISGSRAVYARFPGYQPRQEPPSFTAGGKVARIERVEWIIMPDPATAAAALQAGEIDWIEQPLIDLLPLLRHNADIRVETNDPYGVIGVIVFNHLQPPFDNVKLRRALLPAVDQSVFVSAVMGSESGTAKTGVGVFTVGSPLANTEGLEVLTGPRDIDLARRLVKDFRLQGGTCRAALPVRLSVVAGGCPGHARCLPAGRPERGLCRDRLGNRDRPARQQGDGGKGRLEHLRHHGRRLRPG